MRARRPTRDSILTKRMSDAIRTRRLKTRQNCLPRFIYEVRSMKKKNWIAILCLVTVVALFWCVWHFSREIPSIGTKNVVIHVIHGDESLREFDFSTRTNYLADALVEQKIVENTQGPYGLYILTADGETANEGSQEWWCITKAGKPVNEGASAVVIKDGDQYELTLVKGYS